jgi:sarcosine oxidase, subunit beta
MQHNEGLVEATELGAGEIAEVNPHISLDGVAGAAFCPTDGYIRPLEILRGYIEAGQRLGVRFVWDEEITGVSRDSSEHISQVTTATNSYSADDYVNAAGPWAATIGALAEVVVPVVPLRRQAALTVPTDVLPASMPMTIFMEDDFHLRVRDGSVMLCWPSVETPGEPAELRADSSWIDIVAAKGRERVPGLASVAIDRSRCYAGLYEMSPDDHAIIGRTTECTNFWLANGSSGHGVMHSPAIGHVVADLICGRTPALDVTQLRPSRFAEGAAIESSELI